MHAFGVQRSTVRRSRRLFVAMVAAAIVTLCLLTLPPQPRRVIGADPALSARTARGAFHVHTNRSDGLADKPTVAGAARRAGLQFVVFTDHGDGTQSLDPPEYIGGVLCLDGVEISGDGGHYIALGAAPSRYPLGGESAAVVEDVARLGGFGVSAHPRSPREELAWSDWSLPFDAVEWLNADSEWRDESRWQLVRAVAWYPLRSAAALATLLDRPAATLREWDSVAATRRVLALAGHDAHGGIGNRVEDASRRWSIRVPSYEASFRTFSTHVELDRPPVGNAGVDAAALVEAFTAGRLYSQISAIASGGALEFTAWTPEARVTQGGVLGGAGPASFSVRATPLEGASTILFRNGMEVARAAGTALGYRTSDTGAFRVEVQAPGSPGQPPVPWLVSNPIFRFPPAVPAEPRPAAVVQPLADVPWHVETSAGSEGSVRLHDGGEVEFTYRLGAGPPASQFAALVADLPRPAPPFSALTVSAASGAPARLSIQLRFAADNAARWRKSVYLDETMRPLVLEVDHLRRADGPLQRPAPERATSLLFVVDLTHARPGETGKVTVRDVGLAR